MHRHRLFMRHFQASLLFAALLVITPVLISCKDQKPNELIGVEKIVPGESEAIGIARDQLPLFWEVYQKRERGESEFAILVQLSDLNGTEDIWVTDLRHKPPTAFGVITEQPKIVNTINLNDVVELLPPLIQDWKYQRDGKTVGNFQRRAQLKLLDPQVAAAELATLSETNAPSCPPGCELRRYRLPRAPFELPERSQDIKKEFIEYGIPFSQGGFAYYLKDSKTVVIAATPDELASVDPQKLKHREWVAPATREGTVAAPDSEKDPAMTLDTPSIDIVLPDLDPKKKIEPSSDLKN